MKWFQHYSDSHTNLKLRQVIKKYGMEGYGFFWICDELVANQGHSLAIRDNEGWEDALEFNSRLKPEIIRDMLQFFAEINLISKSSLSKGILAIPKLAKYSDDYSRKRVRTHSVHSPDKILLDNNTLDNNTLDKSIKPPPQVLFFDSLASKPFIESEECLALAAKAQAPPEWVNQEAKKFVSYWREKSPGGKKERWEKEKVFDPPKRLGKWIRNAVEWQSNKRSGIQSKIAST